MGTSRPVSAGRSRGNVIEHLSATADEDRGDSLDLIRPPRRNVENHWHGPGDAEVSGSLAYRARREDGANVCWPKLEFLHQHSRGAIGIARIVESRGTGDPGVSTTADAWAHERKLISESVWRTSASDPSKSASRRVSLPRRIVVNRRIN